MQLAQYLGQNLKSDHVIEVLEHFDMEVIYDFDRLHENTPDSYSSSAKEGGFAVRFNEHQILDTIWCYMLPRSGFSSVNKDIVGAPIFESFIAAKSSAHGSCIRTLESEDGASWIRLEYENLWIHYQFSDGGLALLTFMHRS